jgi:hypothetical protein
VEPDLPFVLAWIRAILYTPHTILKGTP